MDNCIFCKIKDGKIPSYKVYEDDICFGFLDLSQFCRGHLLVISKEHYDNILTVKPEILAHISKVVQKLCQSISTIKGVKGFNIINNCNEVAGQSVMHFHVHICPRYKKDELSFVEKEIKLSEDELKTIQSEIIESLK